MLRLPFSEYSSHKELQSLTMFAQMTNYLYSLHPISFPTPQTTVPPHPINIPKPYLQGDEFEICSLVCSLGCLVNKSFLQCKSQHLSVWLAAPQAKETGSVTTPPVLLLLCCCFLKLLGPQNQVFILKSLDTVDQA